ARNPRAQMLRQVAQVPRTIGMEKQGCENLLSDLGKQGVQTSFLTHYAYILPQIAYIAIIPKRHACLRSPRLGSFVWSDSDSAGSVFRPRSWTNPWCGGRVGLWEVDDGLCRHGHVAVSRESFGGLHQVGRQGTGWTSREGIPPNP